VEARSQFDGGCRCVSPHSVRKRGTGQILTMRKRVDRPAIRSLAVSGIGLVKIAQSEADPARNHGGAVTFSCFRSNLTNCATSSSATFLWRKSRPSSDTASERTSQGQKRVSVRGGFLYNGFETVFWKNMKEGRFPHLPIQLNKAPDVEVRSSEEVWAVISQVRDREF